MPMNMNDKNSFKDIEKRQGALKESSMGSRHVGKPGPQLANCLVRAIYQAELLAQARPDITRVKHPRRDPIVAQDINQVILARSKDFHRVGSDYVPHGKVHASMRKKSLMILHCLFENQNVNKALKDCIAWLMREHKRLDEPTRYDFIDPSVQQGIVANRHLKLISWSALNVR
jgi:hypothetical protein